MQNYGSSPFYDKRKPFGGRPKRSTCLVVFLAIFLPCLVFAAAFGVLICMSQGTISYILLAVVFVGACGLAYWAIKERRNAIFAGGSPDAYSSWVMLIAVLAFIGLVAGACVGEVDYLNNFYPYYYVGDMSTYSSLDTANTSSIQVMDAGIVYFDDSNNVSKSNGMMFKSQYSYCVAPITPASTVSHDFSYSFWAVGTDCCTSRTNAYECGVNTTGFGGLRIVTEPEKDFYNLAVQQAEAWYGITAPQPLFFKVSDSAETALSDYLDSGLKVFGYSFLGFLGFSVLVVIVFSCVS